MRVTHAICRRPGASVADGLTTVDEGRPDPERTCAQFDAYVAALRALGATVDVLDPLDDHPDAHYVEDVAVITPDAVVLTRPGAPQRRAEVEAIAGDLAARAPVIPLPGDGTLDGGDVLRLGDTFYVGRSARTDAAGAAAFAALVHERDFACVEVPVPAGLHLKSSVNALDDETVILTADFADAPAFAALRRLVVASEETYAACALRVNDGVIVPAGSPRTRAGIEALGLAVHEVDTSEFRKTDGGLTCLSLRFGTI